jgi:aspartate aminotransferase
MKAVTKFAQARLCPATLEQYGAVAAYKLGEEYFEGVRKEYQKRRDLLTAILKGDPQVVLKKPEGAFYLMARLPIDDCNHFSRWLLESFNKDNETVMVAPGDGFYSTPGLGKQEVRLAYVLECPKLEKAGRLLLEALKRFNSR